QLLRSEPVRSREHDGPVISDLLQEPQLSGGRKDSGLIILAHFVIDKPLEHRAYVAQARARKVEVVKKEHYRSPPIQRDRPAPGTFVAGIAACGGQLRLFVAAAGRDAIKEGDRPRLALHLQHKLIALQTIDKISLFVEDHEVGLNQRGVDANYVIAATLLRLLSGGQRCREETSE